MIIIDTPNSCVTCPLSHYNAMYSEHQCQGKDYYETINDFDWQRKQVGGKDLKPDWCPLSPVPSKKDLSHYVQRGDTQSITHMIMSMHDVGYNNCIDDILKGENDANKK